MTFSPIRAGARRSAICPTISATICASARAALALGLLVSFPLALAVRNRPVLRGAFLGVRQHRADRAGAGAAGAVLSAAAGAGRAVAVVVRRWLFRVRISALGAGAGAVFDAAGAAQHHHRPWRRRSRDPRGSAGRRHDAAAIAVAGRTAAGAAGDHGGHPHRGGLGDRHRDAVDPDRADQPRQLHLCGTADPELGVRAVRLPRCRRAGARGRSTAGADRDRHPPPQPASRRRRRRRHRGAGGGHAGALHGAFAVGHHRRRQDLCRAICAVGADRAAAAGGGIFRQLARGPRLQRDLRGAGGRRHRRLCRLFRHAVGQPVSPHRHQAARRIARRAENHAGATEHHAAGRTRF